MTLHIEVFKVVFHRMLIVDNYMKFFGRGIYGT